MTIKSQNDLNQPETHSTEVLLSTIEKLERTKKQLEIAKEALTLFSRRKCYMNQCLKGCPMKKYYEKDQICTTCLSNSCIVALKQIEDIDK